MINKKTILPFALQLIGLVIVTVVIRVFLKNNPNALEESLIPSSFYIVVFVAFWISATIIAITYRNRIHKHDIRMVIIQKASVKFMHYFFYLWFIVFHMSRSIELNNVAFEYISIVVVLILFVSIMVSRFETLKDIEKRAIN